MNQENKEIKVIDPNQGCTCKYSAGKNPYTKEIQRLEKLHRKIRRQNRDKRMYTIALTVLTFALSVTVAWAIGMIQGSELLHWFYLLG